MLGRKILRTTPLCVRSNFATSSREETKQERIFGQAYKEIDLRAVTAGDFSSVFKHSVLTSLLKNITNYSRPYTFIDCFCDQPYYDITRNPNSFFTEPRFRGVDRVMEYSKALENPKSNEFEQYIQSIRSINCSINENGRRSKLKFNFQNYPGTASFVFQNMRPQDSYIAIDHKKENIEKIRSVTDGDRRFRFFTNSVFEVADVALKPLSATGIVFYDLGHHSIPNFYPTLPVEFHKSLLLNLENRYHQFQEEHKRFEESPFPEQDRTHLIQEKAAGRSPSSSISPSQLEKFTSSVSFNDVQQDLDKVRTTIVCLNTELQWGEEKKKLSAEKKQELEAKRVKLLQYQTLLEKYLSEWQAIFAQAKEATDSAASKQPEETQNSVQFVPPMPEAPTRRFEQDLEEEDDDEVNDLDLQQPQFKTEEPAFTSFSEFLSAITQLEQELLQEIKAYESSGKAQEEMQSLLTKLDLRIKEATARVASGQMEASIASAEFEILSRESFLERTQLVQNYLHKSRVLLERLNKGFLDQPVAVFLSLQERFHKITTCRDYLLAGVPSQTKPDNKKTEQISDTKESAAAAPASEAPNAEETDESSEAEETEQEEYNLQPVLDKLNESGLLDVAAFVEQFSNPLEVLNDSLIQTMRLMQTVLDIQWTMHTERDANESHAVKLPLSEVETFTELFIQLSKAELEQSLKLLRDETGPDASLEGLEATLFTCAHVEETMLLLEQALAIRFRQEASDPSLSSDALSSSSSSSSINFSELSPEVLQRSPEEIFKELGVDIHKSKQDKKTEDTTAEPTPALEVVESQPAAPEGSHKNLIQKEKILQEIKSKIDAGFVPLSQQLATLSNSELSICLHHVREHVLSFYERHHDKLEELKADAAVMDGLNEKEDGEEIPKHLGKFNMEEKFTKEALQEAAESVEAEMKAAEEELKLESEGAEEDEISEPDFAETDEETKEAWAQFQSKKEEQPSALETLQLQETEPWVEALVNQPECHLSNIITNTQPLLSRPRQALANFLESESTKNLNKEFLSELSKKSANLQLELDQADLLSRLKEVDPVFRPFKTLQEVRDLSPEKRTALRQLILDARPGRDDAISPEDFDAMMRSNKEEYERLRVDFMVRRGRFISYSDLASAYTPMELNPVFDRVEGLLKKATSLFPEAIHYVTFPLFNNDADPRPMRFINACVATGIKSILYAEFTLDDFDPRVDITRGQSVVILNPPLMFDKELETLLQGMDKAVQRLHKAPLETDPEWDMNSENKRVRISKVQWLTPNGPQGDIDRSEWKLNWDYAHYDGRVVKNEMFEKRVRQDRDRKAEELRLKKGPFYRLMVQAMLDGAKKPAQFNPGKFVRGPVLKYLARIQGDRQARNEALTRKAVSLQHKIAAEKKISASPVPTSGDFLKHREILMRSSLKNMYSMLDPNRHIPKAREISVPALKKSLRQVREHAALRAASKSVQSDKKK